MSEDGSGQIDDNDEEEASGIEFSLTNVGWMCNDSQAKLYWNKWLMGLQKYYDRQDSSKKMCSYYLFDSFTQKEDFKFPGNYLIKEDIILI